jgi:cytoskeletal protein RodZ
MSEFGSTFKARREAKGLSLEQIATETRISTRFLQAIERDDFQVLPGGIFSRGFVRAYAEVLGMDPDKAVADFERISNYHEPVVLEGLRVSTPQPSKRNLILYPIAAGVLLLVIAIFYFVTRERPVTVSPDLPKSTVAPPETAASAPAAAPAVVQPPPPPPPVAAQPAAKEPAPKVALTLAVEVTEPTWVKITTDGTSAVAGEILQPGTTRRYTAHNSIYISVGNAAGLSLKINDQRMRPLGRSGQVRSITITPENIKDIIG